MKKRILLLGLCLALFCSFSVVAFAEDSSSSSDIDNNGLLSGLLGGLGDVLKGVFIPTQEWLDGYMTDTKAMFNKQFGGVATLLEKVQTGFNALNQTQPRPSLQLSVYGFKADLFNSSADFVTMIKYAFNGFLIIFTIVLCYKKITGMLKE